MRPQTRLLQTLPFVTLLFAGACTRPPPELPGVEEQLPTTPKTPAQEPTVTPYGAEESEWPEGQRVVPRRDDPDLLGSGQAPVGTPDPDEALVQPR